MTPKQKIIAQIIGAGATAIVVPLVMQFEGLHLRSYRDPVGILTACYGHTGADVKPGQTYTREQCRAMLAEDLAKHAEDLNCIAEQLPQMSDKQKAAFVSFAYNIGGLAFCSSTVARNV